MSKTIVGTRYGKPAFPCVDERFPNAKARKCMGCMRPPWPVRRFVKIYHCTICDSLKIEFKKTDPPQIRI